MSTVQRAAVLGTGTMGQGIAQVLAASGRTVGLYDNQPERAKNAISSIESGLARQVAKGKLDEASARALVARIEPASSIADAVRNSEWVIEAVPEQLDLKLAVLREALAAAPNATFGTNTSSLSVTELGAGLARDAGADVAARTIGLHFFNPPPVMELVEIVRGVRTSEETVQSALDLVASLGKTPIVVRDVAGFATSRLGVLLGAEAMRMLESGVASARDIDRAMELGYRHPMGPLKLTDLVGLDVRLAILEHLQREIGDQFRPPTILRQMVRAGKLGKKSGEGFYVWEDGVAREPAQSPAR